MSKINYNRKTFLSKEELVREQLFRTDRSIYDYLLLSCTKTWGIVDPTLGGGSSGPLRISRMSGTDFVNISEGYTIGKRIINGVNTLSIAYFSGRDNIRIPVADGTYYVYLTAPKGTTDSVLNTWEDYLVSVSMNGQLTIQGNNADVMNFNEVLRGQGSLAPTSIRFIVDPNTAANIKAEGGTATVPTLKNNGVYEVVEVTATGSANLNSNLGFQQESDLRMIVLGTKPIGDVFGSEDVRSGAYDLYTYYGYDRTALVQTSASLASDDVFLLGSVTRSGSDLTISTSGRVYWKLNQNIMG